MNIGENIRKYRKNKGWSIQTLADELGKSKATIQKYETNNINIPSDVLMNIHKILNIPSSLLFDMDTINQSNKNINDEADKILSSLSDAPINWQLTIDGNLLLDKIHQNEFIAGSVNDKSIVESIYRLELSALKEELKKSNAQINDLEEKLSDYFDIINEQNRVISKLRYSLEVLNKKINGVD